MRQSPNSSAVCPKNDSRKVYNHKNDPLWSLMTPERVFSIITGFPLDRDKLEKFRICFLRTQFDVHHGFTKRFADVYVSHPLALCPPQHNCRVPFAGSIIMLLVVPK